MEVALYTAPPHTPCCSALLEWPTSEENWYYIWLKIGAVWGLGRRIVGVLHGLTPNELVTQEGTPALLKRIDLVELNNIDSYFEQLKRRVTRTGGSDV